MTSDLALPLRQLTYALYRGVQLTYALEQARLHLQDPPVVELLVALLEREDVAFVSASRCLDLLASSPLPQARLALQDATRHRFSKLRLAAVEALIAAGGPMPWKALVRQLGEEPDYHVRAALVRLVATAPDPTREQVLVASDDPHWRVRKQLLAVLHTWQMPAATLATKLEARGLRGPRVCGLLAYHSGEEALETASRGARFGGVHEPDLRARTWWSEEPTLLRQQIRALDRASVREECPWLVWLLASPDEAMRAAVMKQVPRVITLQGLLSLLIMASEPRRHDIEATLQACLARTTHDLIEACAWTILREGIRDTARLAELACIPGVIVPGEALLGWATRWLADHVIATYGAGDQEALWREATAHVVAQQNPPVPATPSPSPQAHLARLKEEPELERSWLVLAEAARRFGYRLESHVPAAWLQYTPPGEEAPGEGRHEARALPPDVCEPLATDAPWWELVPLGKTGLRVSRMGISGHYALPERGFEVAIERGITTFFWEPLYLSQTRAFRAMSVARKADLVVCCGTFASTARGLRRDLEQALRAMALEQVQVFYIFWVRDVRRLSTELLEEMARCTQEGLVHSFGVSTHSRALAREFIKTWPAIMVRHNAAHTGIEREVLPFVDPKETGITTFSNLCYGRMISAVAGWDHPAPCAQDAYRYSLSQRGVTSCWSAPSTLSQLGQNLRALELGPMAPDELEHMREYGRALYRLNKRFDALVRTR